MTNETLLTLDPLPGYIDESKLIDPETGLREHPGRKTEMIGIEPVADGTTYTLVEHSTS
jgi:hypothetical protein